MIELKLSRIVIDESKNEHAIVLKERNGQKFLPIVIGINEAAAIKMKLSQTKSPRPLTHDLLASVIDTLGFSLEKVVIDDLVEGTFFAKLYLKNNDSIGKIIDARPSDSIALALRMNSPIFAEEKVFENYLV